MLTTKICTYANQNICSADFPLTSLHSPRSNSRTWSYQ